MSIIGVILLYLYGCKAIMYLLYELATILAGGQWKYMSSDFLFSFDSPKSLQFAIGPVSFSINAEYMAKMKFLFNKTSLYPINEDAEIVSNALEMVKSLIETDTLLQCGGQCQELVYFSNTFLTPHSNYYSSENFQYLRSSLIALSEDIALWIKQNEDKLRKKNASIDAEIKLMDVEEHNLKEKIRNYIASNSNCISTEDDRYFSRIGKEFKHTYEIWLYRISLDDEITEFYFLHYMRASNLKAKLITQCIENRNVQRAMDLMDLLIKTSEYPDYAPPHGNKWELTAVNTIRDILYAYLPRNSEFKDHYTDEKREFVIKLAERLMPYLTEDSQKSILGHLSLVDPNHKYENLYISTLLNDVEHYAQIKKPRGWGNARTVNRISSEIISCFSFLEELGRIDIIIAILSKLKDAGPLLEPINYDRWLNEFCKNNVSPDTFEYLTKEFI